MKYMVTSIFYDNGDTFLYPPVEVSDTAQSSFTSKERYDVYQDIFDTEDEASDFFEENSQN